uniref:Serine/threonine-protein phosphatase 6 regulatory ankyrin repeat subunit B n=1 Tax=Aegilops tauschii TaxID=37682 RepID=M8BZV3_AEGTA
MGLLGMMGDSFGCSATGERLVSAARDGDIQEARALLELNPRLARYSTFGIRNTPLHYSAAKGHHEIVSLLIETGVDINLRNCRGQTALMQACLYGHWKVVQILVLFKANIHKKDCFSGATAIHFAALKGHTRCIRLIAADYVPSLPDFWSIMRGTATGETNKEAFDAANLQRLVNAKSDGGVTPLHLAALHGHAESLQLLLDLGASVSEVTVNDGSTIDLIGSGSTALHYAACGGSAVCCQLLIAAGAHMGAENANGLSPLMVARSWHKTGAEGVLSKQPEGRLLILPSPYLSLPLMSIVKIARVHGGRNIPTAKQTGDSLYSPTAKEDRDGSFAHGYGYPRVPYPETTGMGKTWRDFVPTGNGYPYPQNIWVGHGYELVSMDNPMDTQKMIKKMKIVPMTRSTYNSYGPTLNLVFLKPSIAYRLVITCSPLLLRPM